MWLCAFISVYILLFRGNPADSVYSFFLECKGYQPIRGRFRFVPIIHGS